MARYEHLPIYKAAMVLPVHFEKLVAGFSRYRKYTLGTELRKGSRAVLQQVLRANNAAKREQRAATAPHLDSTESSQRRLQIRRLTLSLVDAR